MKWSFLCLTTTCARPDVGASLLLPPISVPHHVVLSPQLLYPSDSRQCVLRPPTWYSSQGPQGVCVCVCAHFIMLHLSSLCVHRLLFTCSGSLPFVCARVSDLPVPAVCSSFCLVFFLFPVRLPVIRLCIWGCFCTIWDGLKQKLES